MDIPGESVHTAPAEANHEQVVLAIDVAGCPVMEPLQSAMAHPIRSRRVGALHATQNRNRKPNRAGREDHHYRREQHAPAAER